MNNSQSSIKNRSMKSMSRVALFAILALLAFGATACQEELSADLPYVERVMVRGELTVGTPAEAIRFTRTLPINYTNNDSASIYKAIELTDVSGYIEAEGTKYPLVHTGRGEYRAEGLVVKPSVRYSLNATWQGKTVTATTTSPSQSPKVDTIAWLDAGTYDFNGEPKYTLEAVIVPAENMVYSVEYALDGGNYGLNFHETYPDPVRRSTDVQSDHRVHLKIGHYYNVKPSGENYHGSFMVYAWDKAYYNFFSSYYGNLFAEDSDNPFGSQDRAIAWNVSGDGAGTFFARTATEIRW